MSFIKKISEDSLLKAAKTRSVRSKEETLPRDDRTSNEHLTLKTRQKYTVEIVENKISHHIPG